jgi:chemotaxis family two-component system sensor histidine kinase/response regulator PixL
VIKFKLFGFSNNDATIPARPPEVAAQEVPPCPDGDGIPPAGKRVLIVDDDPIFLKVTANKLQSAGYHVRTARESSGAIATLGDQPADAVLMDINFPPDVCNGGMGSWDGFQIMTWLRNNPAARGARFIMVSVSDSAADRQRAQKLGAVAYFHKPLDYDQLLAAMDAGS